MATLYFSRSSFSFSMCGRFSESGAFRHISPSNRDTSVFFISGCCFLSRVRFPCEKYKKADMGRLGALGSFLARFQGTCQGPVYDAFSTMYRSLSLAATSSQYARSSADKPFLNRHQVIYKEDENMAGTMMGDTLRSSTCTRPVTYHISAERLEISVTVALSPRDSLISGCLAMKKHI